MNTMGHQRRPPCVMFTASVLAALLVVAAGRRTASRVRIGMDGGYSDVVVQVSEDLPRADCRNILASLKVLQLLRISS